MTGPLTASPDVVWVYDPTADAWAHHRAAAAARLDAWEARLHAATVRALTAWTHTVRAAVLDGQHPATLTAAAGDGPVDPATGQPTPAEPPPAAALPPDPGAIPPLTPVWSALIHTHITTEIENLLGEVFADVLQQADVISTRPWQENYLANVTNRLVHVADTTFDLVRTEVQDGIDGGESIPKIRDRIQAALDVNGETSWPNRAQVIARTECLPADTPIDGANITAMYRRPYSGPWVTIRTQGGRQLSGTPNHPVLTTRGWVGLGQLTEGDHLICDSGQVEGPGAPGHEHVQGGPATIGEVFDAVAAVAVPVRVTGGQPDFHGDGADGDIEVLRPHGVLRLGSFTALEQRGQQIVLEDADLLANTAAGLGDGFRRSLPVDEGASRFHVAEWDALLAKPDLDGVRVAAESTCEVLDRPALAVERDDRGRVQVVSGTGVFTASDAGLEVLTDGPDVATATAHDVSDGAAVDAELGGQCLGPLPGLVTADQVSSVDTGSFRGHVYNLTCVEGYFAAGSGVVTSNTIAALNGGQQAAYAAESAVTGEELDHAWLATIDVRTRSSHFRADGQRRKLGERFQVGDAHLLHPGDPTGPAGEVLQCRCTLIFLTPDEEIPDIAERGFRDPAEVQAEIARRAAQDPPVVRAYEDPAEQERQAALTADADTADPAVTAPPAPSGETVTAAGSGPGASSPPQGRPPMPRTWASDPHLAPFAKPTGDGRIFKVGSLSARELPLPLLFQPSSGMGHDGSEVVGRILTVDFTDQGIVATGDYLDVDPGTNPDLATVIERAVALAEQGLGHVSVDLSDVVGELVDADGNPVTMDEIWQAWEDGEEPVVLEQVAEGKLIACTQVATPAFEGAKIKLTSEPAQATVDAQAALAGHTTAALQDSAGVDIEVGAQVTVDPDGKDDDPDADAVTGTVTAVDEAAETVTVQPDDAHADPLVVTPDKVTVTTPAPAEDGKDGKDSKRNPFPAEAAITAAAGGPLAPPADWFADPQLAAPTALTITDDGRVYGHAATWSTCHVGYSNTCVTPPPSPSGYAFFHTGEVVCADGTRVAVGNLTLGGRHADVRMGYRSAVEHYDVQGAGVAVVRMYEDEHGIAMAGSLTPGVTEEQLFDLRRSPVSGDWRKVGGELEMIGVLSVNSPGFPTPRFATDAAGRTALVAAPSVRPDDDALTASARKRRGLTQAQLTKRITEDVTRQVTAQLARQAKEQAARDRLQRIAASIRRDPASRMAALAQRVTRP